VEFVPRHPSHFAHGRLWRGWYALSPSLPPFLSSKWLFHNLVARRVPLRLTAI
jgi:hypothetical protein